MVYTKHVHEVVTMGDFSFLLSRLQFLSYLSLALSFTLSIIPAGVQSEVGATWLSWSCVTIKCWQMWSLARHPTPFSTTTLPRPNHLGTFFIVCAVVSKSVLLLK